MAGKPQNPLPDATRLVLGTPDDIRKACPYNNTHAIQPHRLVMHILECGDKKKHKEHNKFTTCKYSQDHVVFTTHIKFHEAKCPEKPKETEFGTDDTRDESQYAFLLTNEWDIDSNTSQTQPSDLEEPISSDLANLNINSSVTASTSEVGSERNNGARPRVHLGIQTNSEAHTLENSSNPQLPPGLNYADLAVRPRLRSSVNIHANSHVNTQEIRDFPRLPPGLNYTNTRDHLPSASNVAAQNVYARSPSNTQSSNSTETQPAKKKDEWHTVKSKKNKKKKDQKNKKDNDKSKK